MKIEVFNTCIQNTQVNATRANKFRKHLMWPRHGSVGVFFSYVIISIPKTKHFTELYVRSLLLFYFHCWVLRDLYIWYKHNNFYFLLNLCMYFHVFLIIEMYCEWQIWCVFRTINSEGGKNFFHLVWKSFTHSANDLEFVIHIISK